MIKCSNIIVKSKTYLTYTPKKNENCDNCECAGHSNFQLLNKRWVARCTYEKFGLDPKTFDLVRLHDFL